METKRNYGLDLLRVFSMVGIVGLHVINQGGFMTAANSKAELAVVRSAAVLFYCTVNTFAMLSGYLYAPKKTVRSGSLIKLILAMLVYSAGAFVLFQVVKPKVFTVFPELTAQALFPPLAGRYWYITCYVLLFAMIPYLSTLLRTLKERQLRGMLLILFVLLSVAGTFGGVDYFHIDKGYSPFWLMFCYLIGAYIRLYKADLPGKRIWVWLAVLIGNLTLVTVLWTVLKDDVIDGKYLLRDYISPFMVVDAAMLLLLFARVPVKNKLCQKAVLSLSNGAFGVYMIHSHILIYDFWLKNAFVSAGKGGGTLAFAGELLLALGGIYLVCWAIDLVRRLLFRVLRIDALADWLGIRLDRLLGWDG